jgi:hypothetical protein
MSTYNLGNDVVTTDNNNNVISSASLAPKPPITPVTSPTDTTNYSGITGGVTQSVMDSYKTFNDAQTVAQSDQKDTGNAILDYMKLLEGKTADTKAANDATGVTTETANVNKYAQELADLNGQATSLNREALAIPIQTQENNRNTGATDRGVAPQDAGALRLNALKALSIGQQADVAAAAATGSQLRLQAAKDKAQQIIDLKYKPIEDEIALKQKQYDLNKDVLNAIDKNRSEALQVSINKEAQDLVNKKATESAVATLMVSNPKANIQPTDSIISAAQKAATYSAQNPLAGQKLQVIGSHIDGLGNKVDTYGFVDAQGHVIPYNSDSSEGNINFGMSVGTMLGLPTYNTQDNNLGVTRAVRNNNPGNIKATANSIKMPGVVGIESTPAADGGNFLIFANPQQGTQAIGQLIANNSIYANISAEAAIKKYNGGGSYGAADVGLDPKKDFQTQLKDPATLQTVTQNIAKLEGFSSASSNKVPGTTGSSTIDTSTAGYTTTPVKNAGGLTQSAIDQAALQYALTGQMPAIGMGSTGLAAQKKNAIQNRAGEIGADSNIAANKSKLTALSDSLNTQTSYLSNMTRSINTVDDNLKLLQDAANKVNSNNSPLINEWGNLAKSKVIGSGDLASYRAAIQTVRSEYSQILARGGTVTDSVRGEAAQLIPDNITKDQLNRVLDTLKAEGENVRTNAQKQVDDLQNQINGILTPKSSASGTTVMTDSNGKQWNVPNDKVDLYKQNGFK